jgi:hypothetical protein
MINWIFHCICVQWNRSERFHWIPIQLICMRTEFNESTVHVYFLFLFDSWETMHEVHLAVWVVPLFVFSLFKSRIGEFES